MQGILETLLAVARGEADLTTRTSDATEVAARAASDAPIGNGVTVAVHAEQGPLRVGADAELAERVLAPVVQNACRFASTKVLITVEGADDVVVFTIGDDGPGVPAEDVPKLFRPGYRGAAEGNGNGDTGAGLGLALAQRLAQAAGGGIDYAESPGGAKFVIRLPAA
jgi:signal transduction histidine kinase